MQVYTYQADLYCKDCGEAIREHLAELDLSPPHPDMEETYDSDEFPKGPYPDGGGVADCPQHCGAGPECVNALELSDGTKIGAWLENALTTDGVEYVRRTVMYGGEAAKLWVEWYADVLDT